MELALNMRHSDYVGINTEINAKINSIEYSKVISILKEYSIEPIKVEKIRSVYKITTEGRIYCLKKMKHGGAEKVQKGMLLSEYLISKGFYSVVKYIKTSDNKLCVRKRHFIYYVTDWIKGRESNFNDFDELKKCASLLADFHLKSKGFTIDNSKITNNNKMWPSIFKKQKNDLEVIREVILSKKVKTTFDLSYFSLIDEYIDAMNSAIKLLEDSHYIHIASNASAEKTICHDSFYYQNILVKRNEKLYIIDLDSTVYDINVYDLGKFIRRILYKGTYAWDFEIARELIEIYSAINPISKEEYKVLLAFIMFPHKYWKLGKKRYINRKKWIEDKYARKLNRVLRYKEKQNEFIQKFIDHYINDEIKKEE